MSRPKLRCSRCNLEIRTRYTLTYAAESDLEEIIIVLDSLCWADLVEAASSRRLNQLARQVADRNVKDGIPAYLRPKQARA